MPQSTPLNTRRRNSSRVIFTEHLNSSRLLGDINVKIQIGSYNCDFKGDVDSYLSRCVKKITFFLASLSLNVLESQETILQLTRLIILLLAGNNVNPHLMYIIKEMLIYQAITTCFSGVFNILSKHLSCFVEILRHSESMVDNSHSAEWKNIKKAFTKARFLMKHGGQSLQKPEGIKQRCKAVT